MPPKDSKRVNTRRSTRNGEYYNFVYLLTLLIYMVCR